MRNYTLILLFLLLLFGSCVQKKEQNQNDSATKPKMSIVKTYNKPKGLNKIASENLKSWTHYNQVSEFLERFEKISPDETLSNALELKDLVKMAKDSISIEILKTSAFKARLNVLENEALRLADMTYIPAITAKEVNNQVAKILLVFGSLNTKINTTYTQKRFNDEIDLNSFFKLDSAETKR